MKKDIKYRYDILRKFIYDNETRKKCRLNNEKYKNSFSRKRDGKYVSIIRKNRKNSIREWSPSNKYRTNYKTSF